MIAKGKAAALAVAVALLAGCAAQSPPAYQRQVYHQPPPAYYPAPYAVRPAPRYVPQQTERATPPKTETARRETAPVDSGPSWRSSPSSGDCVGWWRICHFL